MGIVIEDDNKEELVLEQVIEGLQTWFAVLNIATLYQIFLSIPSSSCIPLIRIGKVFIMCVPSNHSAHFLSHNRFIQYNASSLEKNYKYELLAEHDLGISIDLINPEAYANQQSSQLDPADEKLLEEDVHAPTDTKR